MAPVDLRGALLGMLADHMASGLTPIVSITGPGCTGKSTLAVALAAKLEARGVAACVLDLDCYFRARAERDRAMPPISGYDPAGYEIGEARRDIGRLLGGETIHPRPYNKIDGTRGEPGALAPATALIIEGSMALRPDLLDVESLRLYIDAAPQTQFENRRRREIGLGIPTRRSAPNTAASCRTTTSTSARSGASPISAPGWMVRIA